MAVPTTKLTCGFCGLTPRSFHAGNESWASCFRAVYSVGPDDASSPTPRPRVSGVGFHHHDAPDNRVPSEQHQRFDDAVGARVENGDGGSGAPITWIQIRDIKPPGPEVPPEEQAIYAWGFLFHDACWGVLEQTVSPASVDVQALWRILCSVPCGGELPNWGHNYGGLYMGTMKDQARGEHFVLIGPNTNVVIPSASSNPLRVPELESLVQSARVGNADAQGRVDEDASDNENNPKIIMNDALAPHDPLSIFPLELRHMLLLYLDSSSAANLRRASRAFAATSLTQQFFQSRFWQGREMQAFFDAFLLPTHEMRRTDWMRLYWQLKIRVKYNRGGLGERNRLRVWNQTVWPLAEAMSQVAKLGKLNGGPDWKYVEDGAGVETDWKFLRTARSQSPVLFGELRRSVYRAEVELHAKHLKGVYISFLTFFGLRHVTGLRFVSESGDDVELGYILRGSETYLPIYDSLMGFHAAVDECGFRALALITGQHMVTEYLEWAGNVDSLVPVAVKSRSIIRKLRGSFDGFRLQTLLIPEK